MTEHNSDINIGSSFLPSLLLVLFIGLKLTHHIDWSWWWVLSPAWIPLVICVCAIIVVFMIVGFDSTLRSK